MKKSISRIIIVLGLAAILAGGFNLWHTNGIHWNLLNPFLTDGLPSRIKIKIVAAPEALRLGREQNILILDVRSAEDFAFDHIPEAMLAANLNAEKLPAKKRWLAYDMDGDIKLVKEKLAPLDIPADVEIYILYGGYLNWLANGFEVSAGAADE